MFEISSEEFILLNGLEEDDIRSHSYAIYAHSWGEYVYVGMATDPVRRWNDHFNDGHNPHADRYCTAMGTLIRSGIECLHYIVAVSNDQRSARDIEAAAIGFYGNLNSSFPRYYKSIFDNFVPIADQVGKTVRVYKHGCPGAWVSRTDGDREYVDCEIVWSRGRLRVRSLSGQLYGNPPIFSGAQK